MPQQHNYSISVTWTGDTGKGTTAYDSYSRNHLIESNGKKPIEGSSDPAFRGDKNLYNPEDLLVSTLSSCHMLWYLHLCAINNITVTNYRDNAEGTMQMNADGSGQFVSVTLNPAVTISKT